MSEPQKVYVLDKGSYSDYTVLCAFEREEDARAFEDSDADFSHVELRLYRAGERPVKTITEWDVHAYLIDTSPRTVDGPFEQANVHWDWEGEPTFGPERPDVNMEWYPPIAYSSVVRPGRYVIHARCRHRDLALKAVQDRLAEMKARREGVT